MRQIFTYPITLTALVLCSASFLLFSFMVSDNMNQKTGVPKFKPPTLVHKGEETTLCLSPLYMLNAWYYAERMDSICDTLDLEKAGLKPEAFQFFTPPNDEKHSYSNEGLLLVVDTVTELALLKEPIWASYLFASGRDKEAKVLQDDTLMQWVKGFPIYVVNISDNQTALLQLQDGSMVMNVEAVTKEGEWKPIEYWSHSWCGNSYYDLALPPHHFMMTRGVKCSGNYYTKCRMKLMSGKRALYSNEFYMYINQTQFEKPVRKDNE